MNTQDSSNQDRSNISVCQPAKFVGIDYFVFNIYSIIAILVTIII